MLRETGRRSKQIKGYVNFPVHEPSTGEGGMFVRLVVIPPVFEGDKYDDDEYDAWVADYKPVVCCGGTVSFMYDESFIGTDEPEFIAWWDVPPEEYGTASKSRMTSEDAHFPDLNREDLPEHREVLKYTSIEYLAVLLMGSTGWSGQFVCKYADLTDEGKALYDNVQKLYPNAKLVLQTWLDT